MYITVTDIGLFLDAIGAILVFRYAIPKTPPPINKGAKDSLPPEALKDHLKENDEINPTYTLHEILSFCGISFLVLGFVLQMVGIRFPAPLCLISYFD